MDVKLLEEKGTNKPLRPVNPLNSSKKIRFEHNLGKRFPLQRGECYIMIQKQKNQEQDHIYSFVLINWKENFELRTTNYVHSQFSKQTEKRVNNCSRTMGSHSHFQQQCTAHAHNHSTCKATANNLGSSRLKKMNSTVSCHDDISTKL